MIGNAASTLGLAAGFSLGRRTHAPITRVEIAWYMVASYDRNPIHVDEPFAKAAGLPTVVGQGMLPLGYCAAQLVAEVGHARLRGLGGDFVGSVLPGDELVTDIVLESREAGAGGIELRWTLSASNAKGEPRMRGWAKTFHEEG